MPESERPRSLADTAPAVAPRMISGQFPDEILDPALRELEEKYGVVLDRDALRERLEQGIGFADYGKYAREQFLGGLRLLERAKLRIYTDKAILVPTADIAERVRRRFSEPGPQSQAPGGSLSTIQNTSLAGILENMPGTVAPDSTTSPDATVSPQLTRLPPALSARVHALLSGQRDPTSPSVMT